MWAISGLRNYPEFGSDRAWNRVGCLAARMLRYMKPDFTIALAIGLVTGFILGYGLRAIIDAVSAQDDDRISSELRPYTSEQLAITG